MKKWPPVPPALVIFNCHFDMPSGHLEGDQLRNSLDQIASGQVGDYLDVDCRERAKPNAGSTTLARWA